MSSKWLLSCFLCNHPYPTLLTSQLFLESDLTAYCAAHTVRYQQVLKMHLAPCHATPRPTIGLNLQPIDTADVLLVRMSRIRSVGGCSVKVAADNKAYVFAKYWRAMRSFLFSFHEWYAKINEFYTSWIQKQNKRWGSISTCHRNTVKLNIVLVGRKL